LEEVPKLGGGGMLTGSLGGDFGSLEVFCATPRNCTDANSKKNN